MTKRFSFALIVLITLALCAFTLAQQSSPPKLERKKPPEDPPKPGQKPQQKEDGETINLGSDLVILNIAATDAKGRRLTNLKQSDITVFDEDSKAQLAFFSTTEEPFHVVLMINISGSTTQQISTIRRDARTFLDQLRPGDEIAVVSFAESPTLECDFTSDRNKLERAINRLSVPPPNQAGTSFYDALRIMVEQVMTSTNGRKAFVALTDGVDSTSAASFEDVLPIAQKADATGYIIQVDTEEYTLARVMKSHIEDGVRFTQQQLRRYTAASPDTADSSRFDNSDKLSPLERREVNTKLYEIARDELKELADESGGHIYPIDRLESAPDAFKQIADEIRLQYSVGFYPKPEKRDGRYHELRVEIKIPGVKINTRPGYKAPKD